MAFVTSMVEIHIMDSDQLAGYLGWASDWVHVVEMGVWVRRYISKMTRQKLWLSS